VQTVNNYCWLVNSSGVTGSTLLSWKMSFFHFYDGLDRIGNDLIVGVQFNSGTRNQYLGVNAANGSCDVCDGTGMELYLYSLVKNHFGI